MHAFSRDTVRIPQTSFTRLGTHLPHPAPTTRTELLSNVNAVEQELVRWGYSVAWVNSALRAEAFVSDFRFRPLKVAIVGMTSDETAAAVNSALVQYLDTYNKWSCCIFRDFETFNAINDDLAWAEIEVTKQLMPLAKEQSEALAYLMVISASAKLALQMRVDMGAKIDLPWTKEDLEKEEREKSELVAKWSSTLPTTSTA